MSKQGNHKQSGFTIVELMIATAVFSVVLLIVAAGVISFTNRYYRGVVFNNTQNTARSVINELTQAVQFSSGSVSSLPANGSTNALCINGRPYYYVLGKKLGDVKHVLVTEDSACSPANVPNLSGLTNLGSLNNGRELVGDNMRLTKFTITQPGGGLPTAVTVEVVSGDNDLLCDAALGNGVGGCSSNAAPSDAQLIATGSNFQCRSGAGSQFCAVSRLTAQVSNRLQ